MDDSITYDLRFPYHEAPPNQEQFEWLLTEMSTLDLSFDELMDYMERNHVFEQVAFGGTGMAGKEMRPGIHLSDEQMKMPQGITLPVYKTLLHCRKDK